MRCDELMKTQVECVHEDDTARDCARRMRDRNLGFLPVCDAANRPIGTLTDRDLALRIVAEDRDGSERVGDVMTREVVCCRAHDDIAEAEQLMAQHHKSRMMVVDTGGKLCGVISLSDLAERDSRRAILTMREIASREART